MNENIKERAKSWRKDFKKFMAKCEREEYTDTEIAWAFLYDADAALRDMLGQRKVGAKNNK